MELILDSSGSGNECYIYHYWYGVSKPSPIVIKIEYAEGSWFKSEWELSWYEEKEYWLPSAVKDWFEQNLKD